MLVQPLQKRCLATVRCLPPPHTTAVSQTAVMPHLGTVNSFLPAVQCADIAVQALYQSGRHAGAAVTLLLDPQQALAAAAPAAAAQPGPDCSVPALAPQHRAKKQQQQQLAYPQPGLGRQQLPHHLQLQPQVQSPSHQQQWPHALQRPLYVRGQVEQLTQLLRGCCSLEQLQTCLQAQWQQLPPSCIAVAMQQLVVLQRSQPPRTPSSTSKHYVIRSSADVVEELVYQLSSVLLDQLHVASPQAITAFLAAAAAGRVALPAGALELLASDLVHRALHSACQQHQQQRQQQQQHQQFQQDFGSRAGQQQGTASPAAAAAAGAPAVMIQQRPHITAAAAWALAGLQLQAPAVWAELASLAGEQLEQLSAQDCVLLCVSLTRVRQHEPRLVHALLQRLTLSARQLGPDDISAALWACARAGHYHHAGVAALVAAAAGSMERFSPRSLSRCLWASVALRHFEPRLLRAARVRALARMHQFEPHSLVLVMCALAKFAVRDEQLAAAAAGQALQCIHGFTMRGLANMAWAVAKQQQQQQGQRAGTCRRGSKQQHVGAEQHVQQQLLAAICTAAVPKLASAKPQEVCNLLWACAVMQHRNGQCLDAACSRLTGIAEDAAPQDLAQALWALEVLRHRRKATQRALILHSLNRLHLFGPQALSNLAWAAAASGMKLPRGLPAAVAQQLQVLLPQLTPQGVATTLWALGKMGRAAVSQQLMQAASSHILAHMACYNAQDLCNIAMVCCKAGYKEPTLLQGLAGAARSAAAATLQLSSDINSSNSHAVDSYWYAHTSMGLAATLHAGLGAGTAAMEPEPIVRPHPGTHLAAAAHTALLQKQLRPQGVCNLVWAFAGLGWHDPQLMNQLQQLAVKMLHQGQLQPQHVAGLLQGFALLGESCVPLCSALASCQTAPGVACGGHVSSSNDNRRRSTACEAWAEAPPPGARGASCSTEPAGKRQRAQQLQCHLGCWPADALALLVWAAVASGAHQSCGGFVVAALQQLQALGVSGLSPARRGQLHLALALLATEWGVVVWGEDEGLGWSGTSSSSSSSGKAETATAAAAAAGNCCSQGHQQEPQQHSLLPHDVPASAATALLSGKLVRQCAAAWQEQEAGSLLSQAEEAVVQALQSLGLQPLVHRWIQPLPSVGAGWSGASGTGWSHHALRVAVGVAGAALGPGRRPVALDLLPPAAVSSSWPARVLGKTVLRQKCLQAAGWEVVPITWQEWAGLQQERVAQRQLLQKLLRLGSE